jgi:hypothetical protein
MYLLTKNEYSVQQSCRNWAKNSLDKRALYYADARNTALALLIVSHAVEIMFPMFHPL